MNAPSPISVTDRFAMAIAGLCRAVATRGAGGFLAAAGVWLILRRLRRVDVDLRRLMLRFEAGFVGRLVVRRSVVFAGRAAGARVLPRRFAWLVGLVPYEAAGFASQMRTMLGEPEMVVLLAASPQARRVLRPLCRMLGIEASVLTPVFEGVEAEAAVLAAAVVARAAVREGVARELEAARVVAARVAAVGWSGAFCG